ncbi:MAG: AsmA-like C-terminal region-containing protein [Bacteroidota bacterium]
MKLPFYKRKRFWKRLIISIVVVPILLFFTIVGVVYVKQDAIIQDLIKTANEDFVGTVRIKGSHVAPFANFPNISIDVENLEIFEGKTANKKSRLLHIKDSYLGFNVWDLINGKYNVKSIRLSDGDISIVQHKDGSFNLLNAFKSKKPIKNVEEEFHLDLKSIRLDRIDVSKINEANNLKIDAFLSTVKSSFKKDKKQIVVGLDSKFELSILKNGDSTFIKRKHFEVATDLNINQLNKILTVSQTEITLEETNFGFEGTVLLEKDAELDLHFMGNKPNFDLFLALAPEELKPTLEQFDNKGKIFFDVKIKGKSANGHQPAINAKFGCENGYFNNLSSHKKLENIGFKGSFTNGEEHSLESMKFVLENFSAKPEAGTFTGKLVVENFNSPEIDMRLASDFDLDFLAKFINNRELKGLSGRVKLVMNFKDIIDLEHPEKSIERLNESYYSTLDVDNLKFKTSDFDVPIKNIDLKATLRGHEAKIEKFDVEVGRSDVHISGSISDLPAIIHHTSIPITTDLKIKSKLLDIAELTRSKADKKGVDEQIENLSLNLKFLSSAKAITESPSLPIGEFFIEDLYAKMKHYPHTLHDFHADVLIDQKDFKIADFSGMIDKSDFHFSGKLANYDLWFEEEMKGDTKIEFDLKSKLLQFENLFSYGGENFVPEDYRHEEVRELKIHGYTDLHFKKGLQSTDLYLTQLDGKMKVHPLKFENFNGRIHYEKDQLTVQHLKGKLGHSQFELNADYYLGKEHASKANLLSLDASRLDVDELLNYHAPPSTKEAGVHVEHDKVFSIYDFQFPEVKVKMNIGHLNYHKYLLDHFKMDLDAQKNHMLHVNKLSFDAAGGHFDMSGYLSGKDKAHIYFSPDIKVKNVDLDKFMVKFDNFGQDHLVSENLHGKFSGHITGKIHLHADLVPKIDDSELKIDMTVLNGRIENYAPILALSDYFQDKNLSKVHFDTLTNVFTLKKSTIDIPRMTINSSLGFLEISGSQGIADKMNMNYLIGVPWKMVGQVAASKLFRKKDGEENAEEIQYRQKNSKFVYIKMVGDLENYKISLSKKNG